MGHISSYESVNPFIVIDNAIWYILILSSARLMSAIISYIIKAWQTLRIWKGSAIFLVSDASSYIVVTKILLDGSIPAKLWKILISKFNE